MALLYALEHESSPFVEDTAFYNTSDGGSDPNSPWKPGDDGSDIGWWRASHSDVGGRNGSRYMRSAVGNTVLAADSTGKGGYRTEIQLETADRILRQSPYGSGNWLGSELWFGMSFYVDPNNEADEGYTNQPWEMDCLWQLHADPNGKNYNNQSYSSNYPGPGWRLGPSYSSNGYQWELERATIDGQGMHYFWFGDVVTGQWVDWVIHIVFDYRSSSQGGSPLIQVWKNGSLVLNDSTNPTAMNDYNPMYFKCGLYKASWKPAQGGPEADTRTGFMDSYRIGDQSSSQSEVDPASYSSNIYRISVGGNFQL